MGIVHVGGVDPTPYSLALVSGWHSSRMNFEASCIGHLVRHLLQTRFPVAFAELAKEPHSRKRCLPRRLLPAAIGADVLLPQKHLDSRNGLHHGGIASYLLSLRLVIIVKLFDERLSKWTFCQEPDGRLSQPQKESEGPAGHAADKQIHH